MENLCDKAELTSLIIIKVTLKKTKTFIILIYFVAVCLGVPFLPPLVWGLFSWLNSSVAQGRVTFWEC